MRRLAIVLLLMIPIALVASPAFAAKPTIERSPFDIEFIDQSCGFDVAAHATGITVDISYTDAEGVLHDFQAYPQSKLELTNVDTGKSITINTAGPSSLTANPDGQSFTFVGRGTASFFGDPLTGEVGLFYFKGRFIFSVDAAGNATFTRTGDWVDLCPELS